MPFNLKENHISSKADKTADILELKEIGGVGQSIYHLFRFKSYGCSLMVKICVHILHVSRERNLQFLLTKWQYQ